MNLLHAIQQKFAGALAGLVPDPSPYIAMVKPVQDPRHGDYQANCAMPLAKVLGGKPRDIAEMLVGRLAATDMLEPPEIAGPGFINLRLRPTWLADQLQMIGRDDRLGVESLRTRETVIVDYSSPNVAKPLHVGHLRSTIIGAAIARLLRFLGHHVISDNHLGDWGTQFGILLYGYKQFRNDEALRKNPIRELERLYVHVRELERLEAPPGAEAKEEDDEDSETKAKNPIKEAARQETAKLHAGDPENVRLWEQFMPWCLAEIDRIYKRLDVQFDATHGESFYNPRLPDVVKSLQDKGIAQISNRAVVIFLEPDKPPALIRKTDGAFTYTTSDLATIQYRVENWNPDRILYVVGHSQALHFQNLFKAARRWGYTNVELEHIAFGLVLGPDGKAFATRKGGGIELNELLDEAVERAAAIYEQTRTERKNRGEDVPDLSADERHRVAEVVGIGAVKYADLSHNRTTDYTFLWDKMLAMEGNTGTYMQYVYARIRSIFRKGGVDSSQFRVTPPIPLLELPEERTLALQLLRLEETLLTAAAEYKPNVITAYLWDLAKSYNSFYQNCPVLRAETPALRDSRLLLCDLTARAIQLGLGLLGIQIVERM
jgi:arginyl-tRNA synthetase